MEREIPTTMPVGLEMLATDKSISAHRITNVSPTAIIPVTVPDQQEQRGDDDDPWYRPERAGTQGHDQRRHSIGDLSAHQQSANTRRDLQHRQRHDETGDPDTGH